MWSLGALLFGHLTRNCRCSHCPGINSNYALYSDGFCASDPQPPRRRPSVPPPLTHTHTGRVLTHISRFSLPPPTPCFPSHSATGELIWLLAHSGPIMNELTEICTFRQGKDEEEKKKCTYQKYFWSDTWAQTALHITFCGLLPLNQKCTIVIIWLDAHLQLHRTEHFNCLARKWHFQWFCNYDTLWKIPILGNHLLKLANPDHNLHI